MPNMFSSYIALLLFTHLVQVDSQTMITFLPLKAVVGEDARLECTFDLDGRTYSASNLVQSDADGNQIDLLVSSSSTSAPGSKYRVEEDLPNDRVFFVITNTARSDDGYYLCVIENSGLDVSSNTPSKLTVQYIETVTIDIIPNPVIEGNNVTFECSVNADPIPTIILFNDETAVTRETSNLTYKLDRVDNSNSGNYKCEASNIAGTSTSQIELLDVLYSPVIANIDINRTVVPGEIVVIAPVVSANPDNITYQWITNHLGIDDIDTNPATFTFKASQDVGANYTITVTATNSIGSTTNSVKITVRDFETVTIDLKNATIGWPNNATCQCSVNEDQIRPTIFLCINWTEVTRETSNLTYKLDRVDVQYKVSNNIKVPVGCLVVLVVGIVVGICIYRMCRSKTIKTKDPTSDPQDDVEMNQPVENSDLKRYAASGGELYTEVNLQDKKKRYVSDNGSSEPAPVDMNVEGLQYADLDLTRNCPTYKKSCNPSPDYETINLFQYPNLLPNVKISAIQSTSNQQNASN